MATQGSRGSSRLLEALKMARRPGEQQFLDLEVVDSLGQLLTSRLLEHSRRTPEE